MPLLCYSIVERLCTFVRVKNGVDDVGRESRTTDGVLDHDRRALRRVGRQEKKDTMLPKME